MATKHYVIGSGVSGIMTALQMQKEGFDVVVLSNTPDPRKANMDEVNLTGQFNDEDDIEGPFNKISPMTRQHGSSYGGGATRMSTRFEGDRYFGYDNPIYPNMYAALSKTVSEGGWLDRSVEDLTPNEIEWIAKRGLYDKDEAYVKLLGEFFSKANGAGLDGWESLMASKPRLFDGTDVQSGVVRSFDRTDKVMTSMSKLSLASEIRRKQTEPEGLFTQAQLAEHFPFLKDDKIAGVIRFRGYSFNMHQFLVNAINELESGGAKFKFDTSVTDLDVTQDGALDAFAVQGPNGEEYRIEKPKSASMHLGAYDKHGLLQKTPAKDKIMGVAGVWLEIPAPEGMSGPMKVHVGASNDGKYPLVDLNLIPCNGRYIVGGGYIFTGQDPTSITEASRSATYASMIYALKRVFKDLKEDDIKILPDALCSRSFTYDELPLLDRMPTTGGGHLVITGGDNTGTLSMAPGMASLIHSYCADLNPKSVPSIELMALHEEIARRSEVILRGYNGPGSSSAPKVPANDPGQKGGGASQMRGGSYDTDEDRSAAPPAPM